MNDPARERFADVDAFSEETERHLATIAEQKTALAVAVGRLRRRTWPPA